MPSFALQYHRWKPALYRTRIIFTKILLALMMGVMACEPHTPVIEAPVVTELPTPGNSRAAMIRFAILSDITTTNVWALFDKAGASYPNYAVQVDYWASLYKLSDQRFDFIPFTADGFPSEFIQDGDFITSVVKIHPGFMWSDGSNLTANDVAFTANTALAFELGLYWKTAYDPEYLTSVEAVDNHTVKYYFRQKPGLSEWQYGTLLGQIVNEAYWAPKIVDAAALLPPVEMRTSISELEDQAAILQKEIDDLNKELSILEVNSSAFRTKKTELIAKQSEINGIKTKTESKQNDYLTILTKAQKELFELDNTGEPTFGPWKFSHRENGKFIENTINLQNPFLGMVVEEYSNGAYLSYQADGSYRFQAYGEPSGDKVLKYQIGPFFENAKYTLYRDEASAVLALRNDEVDFLLTPDGLSLSSVEVLSGDPDIKTIRNKRSDIRYLAFNHANPYLAVRAFRRAMACVLNPVFITQELLQGQAEPVDTWLPVSSGFWYNHDVPVLCQGMDNEARVTESVRILRDAGYTWDKEPVWNEETSGVDPGHGLKMPDGQYMPEVSLHAPKAAYDPLRASTAIYIEQVSRSMGIPVTTKLIEYNDLVVDVYGTGAFDMALLGWKVSIYPEYLCTFFDQVNGNLYHFQYEPLKEKCLEFLTETDMNKARAVLFEIQNLLAVELPAIVLYATSVYDAYHNLDYPYINNIDGIGPGLYGAPALAMAGSQ